MIVVKVCCNGKTDVAYAPDYPSAWFAGAILSKEARERESFCFPATVTYGRGANDR